MLEDSNAELVKQCVPRFIKTGGSKVVLGSFLYLKKKKKSREHSLWYYNYNRLEKSHHFSAMMRILVTTFIDN